MSCTEIKTGKVCVHFAGCLTNCLETAAMLLGNGSTGSHVWGRLRSVRVLAWPNSVAVSVPDFHSPPPILLSPQLELHRPELMDAPPITVHELHRHRHRHIVMGMTSLRSFAVPALFSYPPTPHNHHPSTLRQNVL